MSDELWRQIVLGDKYNARHLPELVVVGHSHQFRLSRLPPRRTLRLVLGIHPAKKHGYPPRARDKLSSEPGTSCSCSGAGRFPFAATPMASERIWAALATEAAGFRARRD